MLWLSVAAMLLGLGLIVFGLRGRRIDDHPICRSCLFDLDGVYPARRVCPECGVDQSKRSPRTGNRRKRWRAVAAGCAALVIAASLAGVSVWRAVDEQGWTRYAPTFLLRREVVSNDPATAQRAAEELLRRLDKERITAQALTSAINAVLQRQADADVAWLVEWGQFVEDARQRGAVSDEQWSRYARGVLWHATLRPRSPVRVGDAVPFAIDLEARCSSSSPFPAIVMVMPHVVNGEPIRIVDSPRTEDPWYTAHPGSASHGFDELLGGRKLPIQMRVPDHDPLQRAGWRIKWPTVKEPGKGTLKVRIHAYLFENPNHPRRWQAMRDAVPDDAFAYRSFDLEANFDAVEDAASTVELVIDPTLVPSIASSSTRIRKQRSELWDCYGSFYVGPHRVDLAFDVYWRAGDREWFVGSIVHKAMPASYTGSTTLGHFRLLEDFDPERYPVIDVILRPSPDAARRTPEMTRIWGGEVVIKDVPVEYPNE